MRALAGLLSLTLLLTVLPLQAASFRVVTEEWAPFNYQDHGRPRGFSVELLQAALQLVGEQPVIEFMPWNRAYLTAQKQPDVLIFTMARTPEREALFQWVAPIRERRMYLYRLARRDDIRLQSLEDAKAYRVGSNALEDASTQDLLRLGFVLGQNLELVTGTDQQNLQKLVRGRIDLVVASELQLAYTASAGGLNPTDFVQSIPLSDSAGEYYFAFSLGTAAEKVAALRSAFEQLRSNGTYDALVRQYTH